MKVSKNGEGVIATRDILYSQKDADYRKPASIVISWSQEAEERSLSGIDGLTASCTIEIIGLPEAFSERVDGADAIQALQFAVDIDPYLKFLSRRYDFFLLSGEPYFDEGDLV